MKNFNALGQFFILSFAILLLAGCASNGMDAANGRPMCPMMKGKACCCCQSMMENKDCSCCQKMMEGGMMKDQSAAPVDAKSIFQILAEAMPTLTH